MGRKPGRDGRPMESAGEEELFRSAFGDGWEGMREAALGRAAGGSALARWEAAVEVVRRALSSPSGLPKPFRSAAEVFERYRYMVADYRFEVFLAVLLDAKNRPTQDVRVSTGILNGSLVHPREVFAPAVRERAASVLLVHNHPSGDPAPSSEDRETTRRLRQAGGIVGIEVLDHVIIGENSFFSFREEADWR